MSFRIWRRCECLVVLGSGEEAPILPERRVKRRWIWILPRALSWGLFLLCWSCFALLFLLFWSFSSVTFLFLAQIRVLLLVLITFRSISALSWSFGEIQKSNMADPRWLPLGNHYVITMSYVVITSLCGPHRKHLWTYYLSSKSHYHNFYTWEVIEETRNPPPPPVPEEKKKPCLDRVKIIVAMTRGYLCAVADIP